MFWNKKKDTYRRSSLSSMDNFSSDFDKSWRRGKIFFGVVFSLVILGVLGQMFLAANFKAKNGSAYLITIANFQGSYTRVASEVLENDGHCIKFKNELGLKQQECGSSISVTEF